MKKFHQRRKLQLSPEIIRNLRAEQLQEVQGGSFFSATCQSNNTCDQVNTCKAV